MLEVAEFAYEINHTGLCSFCIGFIAKLDSTPKEAVIAKAAISGSADLLKDILLQCTEVYREATHRT